MCNAMLSNARWQTTWTIFDAHMWKQMTMDRVKSGWIDDTIETVDLYRICIILYVRITECDLVFKCVRAQKFHRFQMRMERVDYGKWHF